MATVERAAAIVAKYPPGPRTLMPPSERTDHSHDRHRRCSPHRLADTRSCRIERVCGSRRGDRWREKRYRAPLNAWAVLEIALGIYFAWTMITLARRGMYAPLPFFVLYLFGFLYVGVLSLVHARVRS